MPNLWPRRAVPTAAAGGGLATDAQVIIQSLDDPERFAVIFDRHADEIHRYAARRLGRQVAGDAAVPAPPPADFPDDDISDRITAERLRPVLLGVLAGLSPADRELVFLVA